MVRRTIAPGPGTRPTRCSASGRSPSRSPPRVPQTRRGGKVGLDRVGNAGTCDRRAGGRRDGQPAAAAHQRAERNDGGDHEPLTRPAPSPRSTGWSWRFRPATDTSTRTPVTRCWQSSWKESRRLPGLQQATCRRRNRAGILERPTGRAGPRAVGYLDAGEAGRAGRVPGPYWGMEGNGRGHDHAGAGFVDTRVVHRAGGVRASTGPSAARVTTSTAGVGDGGLGGRRRVGVRQAGPGGRRRRRRPATTRSCVDTRRGTGDGVRLQQAVVTAEKLLGTLRPALVSGRPLPAGRPHRQRRSGGYRREVPAHDGGNVGVTAPDNQPGSRPSAPTPSECCSRHPPVSADRFREHEKDVLALLAGRTREGRGERSALESEHGPISKVTLGGHRGPGRRAPHLRHHHRAGEDDVRVVLAQ